MLRSLLSRAEKIVIVSRNGTDTAIDDLADGIVQLRQTYVEDRMERWLHIAKMRGVAAERSMHPFTLVEGRFRSFTEYPDPNLLRGAQAELDPTPEAPGMWPGSAALAKAFGRFPTATLTLIETDSQVPFGVQYTLSLPFVTATLRARGRVTAIPPPMVRPDRIWESFVALRRPEGAVEDIKRVGRQLRVLSHFGPGAADPEFAQVVVPLRPPDQRRRLGPPVPQDDPSSAEIPPDSRRARFPHLFEFTADNPEGTPNAIVLFVDGLLAAAREIGSGYTAGAFTAVLQHEVAGYPLHVLAWSLLGDPLGRPLEGIATIHLRVRAQQGHFFVHGVRPWTTSYILQPPEEHTAQSAPFGLVPIR